MQSCQLKQKISSGLENDCGDYFVAVKEMNRSLTPVHCFFSFKSRSAYRVTFLPIMCAFGKNLDFVTEWLDFPEKKVQSKEHS